MKIITDEGHGGYDRGADKYFCLAGGKKWNHNYHSSEGFHGGGNVYEGELNRYFTRNFLIPKLKLCGFDVINITERYHDKELSDRIEEINDIYDFTNGNCFLLSNHFNLFEDDSVFGTEGFVHPNAKETSIKVCSNILSQISKIEGVKIRREVDYNIYKKSNFKILRSKSSSCLIEYGFISNLEECIKCFDINHLEQLSTKTTIGLLPFKN